MTSRPTPADDRPVALITGAGSGIGRASADRLIAAGFRTVLVGRRKGPLREAADALGDLATVLPADIGNPADARALIGSIGDAFGRLDVLVNNAGTAPLLPIAQTGRDVIDTAFRVNAEGPAHLIALAWPMFERQQSGRIVNVSTMGTRDPFPGFFAYAASKAALNSMTRSCASEGRELGIRAFTVAPGAVETEMLRGLFGKEAVPPEMCLSPDEVAAVIADCATGRRDTDSGKTIWLQKGSEETTDS
ncbi:MAG: SDR family oxidoreductase [Planctomycetota bacterium]